MHTGITKTKNAYRQNIYYPDMGQLMREWAMSIEQSIRESKVDDKLTRLAPQNSIEHTTAPEDAMQIDLVPELPTSGGSDNIVTAMDMYSRYLFAYPTHSQDAKTIAKVISNIMTTRDQSSCPK